MNFSSSRKKQRWLSYRILSSLSSIRLEHEKGHQFHKCLGVLTIWQDENSMLAILASPRIVFLLHLHYFQNTKATPNPITKIYHTLYTLSRAPPTHNHLLCTNLSLSRSKVLLILHRAIHNLLDQHSNRRRISGRSLETLHLSNLLGLGSSYNSQAVSCGALDLSGELLVVGSDVDAPLLNSEHGGLSCVEARGAGLEL